MSEFVGQANETDYMGKSIRTFNGTYTARSNNLSYQNGEFFLKELIEPVKLAIHPNLSRRIIINVPGANGDIDGFADKYKKLAHHMQSTDLGAVVRTGNQFRKGFLPDFNAKVALEYAREHAWEICGEAKPEILLMGFSAGASAIAAIAREYPEVSKMLLFAPSGDMGHARITQGLVRFKGDLTIVIGENDEIVGSHAGQHFYNMSLAAKNKELFTIPDCDHHFSGEINGRIISEAPFYAFNQGEKPLFPDPIGGIKLYE